MAGDQKRRIVYFDTSIFIAQIKNEETKSAESLKAIGQIVMEANKKRVQIVTSTLTRTEVLEARMDGRRAELFNAFLDQPYVTEVNVDHHISELAAELRNHYADDDNDGKLKTPDAIHLATAIHYNAEIVYTYDGPLQKLTNNVAGKYVIPIEEPKIRYTGPDNKTMNIFPAT